MKQRIASIFFLGAVMMCSAVIQAQGVYVIQGPNGPAFSDKPQTGAKEVTLRPLSVVPAIPEPVSYTHLDVYKRQVVDCSANGRTDWMSVNRPWPRPCCARRAPRPQSLQRGRAASCR